MHRGVTHQLLWRRRGRPHGPHLQVADLKLLGGGHHRAVVGGAALGTKALAVARVEEETEVAQLPTHALHETRFISLGVC